MFWQWKEFLSRLSQGAAVAEGGAVSHTRNQLEAAVQYMLREALKP